MKNRIQLLGINIDPLTMNETISVVEQFVSDKMPLHLMGVNADKINQCHSDDEIKRIVNESEVINADGASVNDGNFVSENQTDFIFAVAGEEYGFMGCCTIVLLLLAIAIECIRMGLRAKDLSGKIICCGMGSIVSLQSFLNICVATGIAPNTGTPLPFVSYGLTSLVSLYIGMGLVLNVGLQSSAYNKELQKKAIDQKEDYL